MYKETQIYVIIRIIYMNQEIDQNNIGVVCAPSDIKNLNVHIFPCQ